MNNLLKNTFLFLFVTSNISNSIAAPLALIYKGPGSCVESCSESPAEIVKSMGYEVKFVGPNETSYEIFKNAAIWIQTGGSVREQYKAISPALKENIVKFVKEGGSYIGLCAGALLASEGYYWDGKEGPFVEKGLNFFPGYSTIYQSGFNDQQKEIEADIIPTIWDGVVKYLYWEGGPVFTPTKAWKENNIEILSTYPNKYPASMRRKYFLGKVIVTAFHPEAISSWLTYYNLTKKDKDGPDFDVLKSMVTWAE
jgi:glutamine amidotransferase-like uncharacterized protein